MAEVLSLFNYKASKDADIYPFLIFTRTESEHLYQFSPDTMQLSEDIYVNDLCSTKNYWQRVERKTGKAFGELVAQYETDAISVLCHHPFQGLLFLLYLKQQGAKGHYAVDSFFSQKTLDNMSWKIWLQAAEVMYLCFDKLKLLCKERKNFHVHLARLQVFFKRMGMEKFTDLSEANFCEIQRRFDRFIGLLWYWTFPLQAAPKKEKDLPLFAASNISKLLDFPWVNVKLKNPPTVKNHLEYPLSLWEHIEAALLTDIEKLFKSKSLKPPAKIMELLWELVLYDGDIVTLIINFKLPIAPEAEVESGCKVTLQQLGFGFSDLKKELLEKAKEIEFITTQLVAGWSLTVSKIIYPSSFNLDFLQFKQDMARQELIDLQNKIRPQIKTYKTNKCHIPGYDFLLDNSFMSEQTTNEQVNITDKREEVATANDRFMKPLFVFKNPTVFLETEICKKKFIERTSSDWWSSGDALDSCRDYYMCELKTKELIWAFRDYQGKWFKHGLFS